MKLILIRMPRATATRTRNPTVGRLARTPVIELTKVRETLAGGPAQATGSPMTGDGAPSSRPSP